MKNGLEWLEAVSLSLMVRQILPWLGSLGMVLVYDKRAGHTKFSYEASSAEMMA